MKANVLLQIPLVVMALYLVADLQVVAKDKKEKPSTQSSFKQTESSQKGSTKATSEKVEVELVGANSSTGDEKEVVAALKKLLAGIADCNETEIADCLSDDVSILDARTSKYIHSKDLVLGHIKKNVIGTAGDIPVKKLVVYNPFISVKGSTAMVSFRATKEMADNKSSKLESWCAEVFEKKDGKWLVLQLKTNWKPIKSNK